MVSLVGNEAARQAFAAALDSGSLHHAWLIAGPEGVGKGSFARAAGAALVGGGAQRDQLIAARAHPDVKLIEREIWAKPDVLMPYDERKEGEVPARSIRVVQIRWLRAALATRPSMGERRVVIVDAVDDLEAGGANALLKEPGRAAAGHDLPADQPRTGATAADGSIALSAAPLRAARRHRNACGAAGGAAGDCR